MFRRKTVPEFTGERVIPGHVNPDLWNEHLSRYAFATRLARKRRIIDVGCGAGYGSAELASSAASVVGVDISVEAAREAAATYGGPAISFAAASCTELPFAEATFDLAVAFEVIEHLNDWQAMLREARRVLAPHGQLVVSTPNRLYYEQTRAASGPNPFHVHEFSYEEFRDALLEVFPHIAMFVQNHAEAVAFCPTQPSKGTEARLEGGPPTAATAHFFIAVCAATPQMGAPTFLYLPKAGNVLRERELHISKLELDLAASLTEHASLVELHREQNNELQQANRWAAELDVKLTGASARIAQLQDELVAQQTRAQHAITRLEAEQEEQHRHYEKELATQAAETASLRTDLEAKQQELLRCITLLHQAEQSVEERTQWAQSLDAEVARLNDELRNISGSKWLKLGRTFGLGPRVTPH